MLLRVQTATAANFRCGFISHAALLPRIALALLSAAAQTRTPSCSDASATPFCDARSWRKRRQANHTVAAYALHARIAPMPSIAGAAVTLLRHNLYPSTLSWSSTVSSFSDPAAATSTQTPLAQPYGLPLARLASTPSASSSGKLTESRHAVARGDAGAPRPPTSHSPPLCRAAPASSHAPPLQPCLSLLLPPSSKGAACDLGKSSVACLHLRRLTATPPSRAPDPAGLGAKGVGG